MTSPGAATDPSPAPAPSRSAARGPLPSGVEPPPPTLTDRGVRLLLALAIVLMGISWWRLDGYQLADSVEYMERAVGMVEGRELLDSQSIRSFGYSGLFLPVFGAARLLGLEDWRVLPLTVRLIQIGLSLGLVLATVRLGARLAGRAAGLAGGALLVANPCFLTWAVSPVSGIAAGLCIALALEHLLDRGPPGRAWRGGLWLGASFLMAYQSIIVILPILGLLLLREWRGNKGYPARVLVGVAALVVVQCFLDWLYYGTFGISVLTYAVENTGSNAAILVYETGKLLGSPAIVELSREIYNLAANVEEGGEDIAYQEAVKAGASAVRNLQTKLWYAQHAGEALVLPALLLVGLGVLKGALRWSWRTWLLLAVVVLNVLVMSQKGSKSFRLWLPFFSLISAFGAVGWGALFAPAAGHGGHLRKGLGGLVVALAILLGARQLLATNTQRYGGFWRAMDALNALAEETRPERERRAAEEGLEEVPRLAVSCSYHWAVYLRESPEVELIKLDYQVDRWKLLDEEQRAKDLARIAELDAYVAHLAVLMAYPGLFEAINAQFEVHRVLFDRAAYGGLGPIVVLRRRTGDPGAMTFWDLTVDGSVAEHRARHGLSEPRYHFLKPRADGSRQELALLGWDWRPLPDSPWGWITYHWYGGPFDGEDYVIVDRLASHDTRNVWHNDHRPAYGVLPFPRWGPGWILREGYPVVLQHDPYTWEGPDRPLGGAFRRGDLMPAWLSFKIVSYDESDPPLEVSRLVPYPLDAPRAVEELSPPGGHESIQGHKISADMMARVGGILLPVPPGYRWPDDGTEVPTEQARGGVRLRP